MKAKNNDILSAKYILNYKKYGYEKHFSWLFKNSFL